jgi:dCTP deaminase
LRILENGYDLLPGAFLLGWTVEKLQLPPQSRLAARVEGKSSLARLGLGVHVTAPTIHAGFGYKPGSSAVGQPLQLEIWNIGPLTIRLTKGMAICQLIFEEVHGTPDKGYAGHFTQQGPVSG